MMASESSSSSLPLVDQPSIPPQSVERETMTGFTEAEAAESEVGPSTSTQEQNNSEPSTSSPLHPPLSRKLYLCPGGNDTDGVSVVGGHSGGQEANSETNERSGQVNSNEGATDEPAPDQDEQLARRHDESQHRRRRRRRHTRPPRSARITQQNADVSFEGITPPPPALVSSTIPSNQYFKSKVAGNLAAVQLTCGIALLVCGFGISDGVQGNHLPFYFSTMMPLWVGALISFYMILAIACLILSILLCSFILPDVTSYDTEACYNNATVQVTTPKATEDDQLQCNEAQLLTVLSYITMAFGFLDAFASFAICVVCARALCSVCAKPAIHVLQEAPVYFGVGDNGEMEANILPSGSTRPVVVSLPRYHDVVSESPSVLSSTVEEQLENATPPTPPPSYSSMRSSVREPERPRVATVSWEVDHHGSEHSTAL